MQVIRTAEFDKWLARLRDLDALAKITTRLDRLMAGNPGDIQPVGAGISEMRIHYGPGYRLYCMQRDQVMIILLCGGDKSTQTMDIKNAKALAIKWEKEYGNNQGKNGAL